MQRPPPVLEDNGPTVVSYSNRYTELLTASLVSFSRMWRMARSRYKRDLAALALEVLPSPTSTKVAESIETIYDARVLAAIERWLRDKEAMRELHERSSRMPDAPFEEELIAPARPSWGPPLPRGPERLAGSFAGRIDSRTMLLEAMAKGVESIARTKDDPPDELRVPDRPSETISVGEGMAFGKIPRDVDPWEYACHQCGQVRCGCEHAKR